MYNAIKRKFISIWNNFVTDIPCQVVAFSAAQQDRIEFDSNS